MGLERVACVLQGKLSNYDTDLLRPIIDRAAELFGVAYGDDPRTDVALRINADHGRATAFLIHDGVLPSNEGRGYVLRKIMRRAMRNARMIGRERAVSLRTHRIRRRADEARVSGIDGKHPARGARGQGRRASLRHHVPGGRENLSRRSETSRRKGGICPAPVAFKLYDTFGLALDEQEEMARERGLTIDHDGFQAEMEKQRTRARASWKGADKAQIVPVYLELPATEFVGRKTLEASVKVIQVIENDGKTELVLDPHAILRRSRRTGGRHGRAGFAGNRRNGGHGRDTYTPAPGVTVHKVELLRRDQRGR